MKLDVIKKDKSFDYKYLLNRIWPYIKPLTIKIIIAFSLAIPLGLLDGVTAFALKPYIDVVINGNTYDINGFALTRDILASLIPWLIIAFAIIQGVLKYLNSYLTEWIALKISISVKEDLYRKLVYLDSKFYDLNTSGLVISRFFTDPDTASKTIIDQIKTLITSFTGAFGLIFVLLYNSWQLAFVGVAVLVCAFLPVALIRKRVKKVSNASMIVSSGMTTTMNETYHGNKIISGYQMQDQMYVDFKAQIRSLFDLSMSLTKRSGWLSPIMYFIASIGIAVVMVFGNHLIITEQLTTGALASFITSLLLLYKPIKTLGNTLTNMQNVFVAMNRVFELFDLEPEIKDEKDAKELTNIEDGIEFKNVVFEYVENKPVLNDISFKVEKGKMLALVGNSGGGKSTIVSLIPRFYDVKSGSISIDSTNIKEFSLSSLRNNISEVFQDNYLFSGTIKDNILIGKKDATQEEISNVVKLAHLDEFVSTLELGLDTIIGEKGVTLSGGQRQRVAIARAMIKNAPILILDEATSALDNKSEKIVQQALENLIKDKTVFVIAHRLSTIQNADCIAVINDGKLVEMGNHQELLNIENGQYRYLYETQFSKNVDA